MADFNNNNNNFNNENNGYNGQNQGGNSNNNFGPDEQQGNYTFNGNQYRGVYSGPVNNNAQYNQNAANEFSYTPSSGKKSTSKIVLTSIIAVLCVAAVSVTSIVGYSLITGKKSFNGLTNAVSSTSEADTSSKTTIDRQNLPTLEQLATPSDAMTVPDIVKKVSPSVVGISCMLSNGTATGTGIIMSEDGYIITNAHVVSGAKTISVVLPNSYAKSDSGKSDGSSATETSSKKNDSSSSSDNKDSKTSTSADEDNLTYTAELVGKDTQTDIAVLKIDKKGLTAAEFGKSEEIQVGEISIVIGNPLGLDLANSVTAGIISAKDRTITVEDRTMNVIQTDASINNGNSGGPLINAYGQVIGITSAKVSTSIGEGLGFAIPIDEALPIIKDLMKNGYVTGRPSIGVSGTDVSATMSEYYGIPQGFLVASVTEGGGAAKAGIQKNDVIIGINDTVVTSISELNAVKNKCKVGDTVTITVYRNGKKVDFKVTLTEASNQEEEQNDDDDSSKGGYNDYRNFFDNYDNYGGGNGNDGYYDYYGGYGY